MDNLKELTSLPMPELLPWASRRKDWKWISAESSLMSPRRSYRSRDWTEVDWTEQPQRITSGWIAYSVFFCVSWKHKSPNHKQSWFTVLGTTANTGNTVTKEKISYILFTPRLVFSLRYRIIAECLDYNNCFKKNLKTHINFHRWSLNILASRVYFSSPV